MNYQTTVRPKLLFHEFSYFSASKKYKSQQYFEQKVMGKRHLFIFTVSLHVRELSLESN
jgi:hypothetical protein